MYQTGLCSAVVMHIPFTYRQAQTASAALKSIPRQHQREQCPASSRGTGKQGRASPKRSNRPRAAMAHDTQQPRPPNGTRAAHTQWQCSVPLGKGRDDLGGPELDCPVVRHGGEQVVASWRHVRPHDLALMPSKRLEQRPIATVPHLERIGCKDGAQTQCRPMAHGGERRARGEGVACSCGRGETVLKRCANAAPRAEVGWLCTSTPQQHTCRGCAAPKKSRISKAATLYCAGTERAFECHPATPTGPTGRLLQHRGTSRTLATLS